MPKEKTIPKCPVETTLMLINSKWKILILRDLINGTMRFNELMRSVSGITQKVLTSHHRENVVDYAALHYSFQKWMAFLKTNLQVNHA